MELYDKGEEKAFLELFKIFAIEKYQPEEDRIGILGMTPQDVSDLKAADKMRELFQQKYDQQAVCYGMGDGLEEIKKLPQQVKILWFLRQHLWQHNIWRRHLEHRMKSVIHWQEN